MTYNRITSNSFAVEMAVKKIQALLIVLAAVACSSFGDDAGSQKVNVFERMVYTQWLTKDTVKLENLKYTDTYPAFFFWAQRYSGRSRRVRDNGAAEWIRKRLIKFETSNVALIGVLVQGDYEPAVKAFPALKMIPQLRDHKYFTMEKVCGLVSHDSIAVINPEGELLEVWKTAFSYVMGQPEHNYFETVIMSEKKQPWITYPYKVYKNVPATLKKLPFYLKYGHFGKAYKTIKPYINSSSEKLKNIAAKAMERITKYQKGLINDIKALVEQGRIDEAYRLASNALNDFKGMKCKFVDILIQIRNKYKKDPTVKKLVKAQNFFRAGMKYFKQGKRDYAMKYFATVKHQFPETYYGKKASLILEVL